jgi:hypothetical protein
LHAPARALDSSRPLTETGALTEAVAERFVIRQNIEHYRELLKITRDPTERQLIEKLLFEEEAKLKKFDEDHKKK